MIQTKIVADSINPHGVRLTSFILTYPRFLHSEFLTHRIFSRNAASSRAIPFQRMVEMVENNPALPEKWGAEQKGMQSGDEIESEHLLSIKESWRNARYDAIDHAEKCSRRGLHKSLCNRLLEPFAHITVLATATDAGLSNFFALRAHPAAMPEFQVLAYRMLDLYLKREPVKLEWGDWHIPEFTNPLGYQDNPEYWKDNFNIENRLKIATARCARLSYLTFDGEHSPEKDIELHDRLLSSAHLSPFEHCAQAIESGDYPWSNFDSESRVSHWMQYRKTIPNENILNIDMADVMARKPDWITL